MEWCGPGVGVKPADPPVRRHEPERASHFQQLRDADSLAEVQEVVATTECDMLAGIDPLTRNGVEER